MVKITFFQFFNAGIFLIAAEIAASYSTFTLAQDICSQTTQVMILNAILPNLTLFILDYSEIISKVKRYIAAKGWIIYTQAELNEIFIGPEIDLPNKYGYILKTLLLTAFYASLIPIVVVISMIGLLILYFVEKILYTKSYSLPHNVSSMSYESAIELLEYFLIIFSMGEQIVFFYFYDYNFSLIPFEWKISILLTISLSVLNSALPMEALNEYLFKIE